jgi:hypothetical protein
LSRCFEQAYTVHSATARVLDTSRKKHFHHGRTDEFGPIWAERTRLSLRWKLTGVSRSRLQGLYATFFQLRNIHSSTYRSFCPNARFYKESPCSHREDMFHCVLPPVAWWGLCPLHPGLLIGSEQSQMPAFPSTNHNMFSAPLRPPHQMYKNDS